MLSRTILFVMFLALACEVGAQSKVVAVYQFRSENLQAMGSETELMLATRSLLASSGELELISVREISDRLSRAGLSQSVSLMSAISGGRELNASYVVTGSVKKDGPLYRLRMSVIDVALSEAVGTWELSGNTSPELIAGLRRVGPELMTLMTGRGPGSEAPSDVASEAVVGLQAEVIDGRVTLSWTSTLESGVIGFNIYKSDDIEGDFAYLASVVEPRFVDDIELSVAAARYTVGVVTQDGSEIRTDESVTVSQEAKPTYGKNSSAPLILNVEESLRGIEFTCAPSTLVSQTESKCFVYRSVNEESWELVSEAKATRGALTAQFADLDVPDEAISIRYVASHQEADGLPENHSSAIVYEPIHGPIPASIQTDRSREVAMQWDEVPEDFSGIRLYKEKQDGVWTRLKDLRAGNDITYVDTSFDQDGVLARYKTTFFGRLGESLPSAIFEVTTKFLPDGPRIVDASTDLAKKIELQWEPLADNSVSGYVIMRSPKRDGDLTWTLTEIARIKNKETTSYTDAGGESRELADGQQYVYAIAALNEFDVLGEIGPVATGATLAPPSAVESLRVSVSGPYVKLSWEPGSRGDALYRLERSVNSGDWLELVTLKGESGSWEDTELPPLAPLQYRVIRVIDGLESEPVLSAPITSPLDFTLQATSPSGAYRQIILSWPQIMNFDELKLYRYQSNSEEPVEIGSFSPKVARQYVDSEGLGDDQEFNYYADIVINTRSVATTEAVAARTQSMPIVSGIQASKDRMRSVRVNWDPVNSPIVTGYEVFRRAPGSSWVRVGEVLGRGNAAIIDGASRDELGDALEFEYYVVTINQLGGRSEPSEIARGATKSPPAPPEDLNVLTAGSAFELSWRYNDDAAIDGFRLERKRSNDGEWVKLVDLPSSARNYKDDALQVYSTHQYRLRAYDGDALASAAITSLSLSSPKIVQLYVAEDNLLRRLKIRWSEPSGADRVDVMRRATGLAEDWSRVHTIYSSNELDHLDDYELVDGQQYEYRLELLHNGTLLGRSNVVAAVTREAPPPPENVTAQSGLDRQVKISWIPSSNPDVMGYSIYRVDEGGVKRIASVADSRTSEFVDEGVLFNRLRAGVAYSYYVVSYNRFKGEGKPSPTVSATTALADTR